MEYIENLASIKMLEINKVKPGHTIVNLGKVVEVFENTCYYELVIERMSEKQVLKFEKETILVLTESD